MTIMEMDAEGLPTTINMTNSTKKSQKKKRHKRQSLRMKIINCMFRASIRTRKVDKTLVKQEQKEMKKIIFQNKKLAVELRVKTIKALKECHLDAVLTKNESEYASVLGANFAEMMPCTVLRGLKFRRNRVNLYSRTITVENQRIKPPYLKFK
ncbi:unnamed protein product [Rhizophagus irregularis]|nr:unnamed protein product [Rhizophagus irregularis]CAB4420684.1 unnamed protein product [Rhizophagus irregularis]